MCGNWKCGVPGIRHGAVARRISRLYYVKDTRGHPPHLRTRFPVPTQVLCVVKEDFVVLLAGPDNSGGLTVSLCRCPTKNKPTSF